jgi:hypothetical protein
LKNNLFKNGGDGKARGGQRISTNIDKCIKRTREGSMMVEKEIDETGRIRVWASRMKMG